MSEEDVVFKIPPEGDGDKFFEQLVEGARQTCDGVSVCIDLGVGYDTFDEWKEAFVASFKNNQTAYKLVHLVDDDEKCAPPESHRP